MEQVHTETDGMDAEALARRKLTDIFSRDELRALTARSDARGAFGVLSTWAVLGACFAGVAWSSTLPWPLFLPIVACALVVIAGRQLALAILMHEASHKTLFKTSWLNDAVGDWLCARPIWGDVRKYRTHHLAHHRYTGQPEDTDLSLVAGLPCTRASLRRKLIRDLVGFTGLKFLVGRALMDAGYIEWTVANDVRWLPERRGPLHHAALLVRNAAGALAVNTLLLGLFWLSGYPWLFALWVVAYVTPFPLFVRLRSLAEHACTEPSRDPLRNTRTTRAGVLARMTVAPVRVNFHIEHHALPGVPYFRLPNMHQMLRARGVVPAPPSYREVLERVTRAA